MHLVYLQLKGLGSSVDLEAGTGRLCDRSAAQRPAGQAAKAVTAPGGTRPVISVLAFSGVTIERRQLHVKQFGLLLERSSKSQSRHGDSVAL
jgi:hypothetical protein